MLNLRGFLWYWLPVLLWMTVIFSFSSDSHSQQHSAGLFEPFLRWLFPHASPDTIAWLHHMVRKLGHLTEYAILGLLVWRALHQTDAGLPGLPAWSWPKVGGTLLVVFVYAATDEFHQRFVPGRTPLVSDVFIDTAGAAAGLMALWVGHLRRASRQKRR